MGRLAVHRVDERVRRITLCTDAQRVPDPGYYNSIAGLTPLHAQTLKPLNHLPPPLQDLFPHTSNSLKATLLHNNPVDRNFVLGHLLLDLEPPRPDPADSGADP